MACKSKTLLLYNNNCNIEFSRLLFILSSQRLSVNSKEVNLILFLNQNICEIIGNPRLVSFLKKISYQSIHVSDYLSQKNNPKLFESLYNLEPLTELPY